MSNPFARLEELSTQLNSTSDSLNESIKRVEAKLASLRLGVQVWLDDPLDVSPIRDGEREEKVSTYFGYSKINGAWHLAVYDDMKFVLGIDESDDNSIPLQQASREFRIKALQRIPELIKALENGAEKELKNVQAALRFAESL